MNGSPEQSTRRWTCSLAHARCLAGVAILLTVTSLLSSGCCLTAACGGGAIVAETAVPGAYAAGCDGGCGGGCDACGTPSGCDDCGGGSEVVFPASCGHCSTGACGGPSGFLLPLLSTRLACGGGCGDVYWNEWISDPPECCGPCNDDGCWVGPRSGNCMDCGYHTCGIISGALHGVTQVARGVLAIPAVLVHGYRGGCSVAGPCTVPGCADCAPSGSIGGHFLAKSPQQAAARSMSVASRDATPLQAPGAGGTGVAESSRIPVSRPVPANLQQPVQMTSADSQTYDSQVHAPAAGPKRPNRRMINRLRR